MIIAIILSSLALLAAITAIGLCLRERKRSQERNTAMMHFVEQKRNSLFAKIDTRLKKLETGVVPDYERAKEAATAVNNFNAGITGILGFDPYAALQAQRDKDRGGE